MVLVIKKNTTADEVRSILRKSGSRRKKKSSVASFFGKLPGIEDGLTYQKRARNEWK
jgi:hypothetical protein